MEATAAKMASRMWEVQPLTVVRVFAIRLAIVRRRLIGEYRLLAVLQGREARPDFVVARLERVDAAVSHFAKRRQGVRVREVAAGAHVGTVQQHARSVGLGRPR